MWHDCMELLNKTTKAVMPFSYLFETANEVKSKMKKELIYRKKTGVLSSSTLIISLWCSMLCLFIVSCEEETKPLPTTGRAIKSFKLEHGQIGAERIDVENFLVQVTIDSSVDLTSVMPQITVSEGATLSPASGTVINISKDLQYRYVVTSAAGQAREWIIQFDIVDNDIQSMEYGTFLISGATGGQALGVEGDLLYNDKYWDHAAINVEKEEGHKWQKWHLVYRMEDQGERFFAIRNLFSGLWLTHPEESVTDGASLYQDQAYSAKAGLQLWSFRMTESGRYKIVNKQTGLLLTLTNGTVRLMADRNEESQQWVLNIIPFESYRDVEVQNFFRRNEPWMGSVAFDQGNSIPLSWGVNNGKILWITEDAWDAGQMLGPDLLNGNSFFKYNNSILMQPSRDNWDPHDAVNLTNPETGHPDRVYQMMDVQEGMDWTWPGVGVEIGDKAYIYAGEGKGLDAINDALYILHQHSGTSWKVERETPRNVGGADGMIKGDDGYVYCYSHQANDGIGYTTDLFVRRFSENNPLADWTFWDGNGWSTDPGEKKSIATSKATTSVAKVGDMYLMMSMDMGFWCTDERNIYLSYSNSPVGPFTQKVKVYEIEENINGDKARFYTPIIHPWCVNEQNELLLTYCLNFSACNQTNYFFDENGNKAMSAYYYRLKAVRVPLSVIGL